MFSCRNSLINKIFNYHANIILIETNRSYFLNLDIIIAFEGFKLKATDFSGYK